MLARSRGQRTDISWCNRLSGEGLIKGKGFEFRVELIRSEGDRRSRIRIGLIVE